MPTGRERTSWISVRSLRRVWIASAVARVEGAVRGVEAARVCTQQHADHAAQAQDGESLDSLIQCSVRRLGAGRSSAQQAVQAAVAAQGGARALHVGAHLVIKAWAANRVLFAGQRHPVEATSSASPLTVAERRAANIGVDQWRRLSSTPSRARFQRLLSLPTFGVRRGRQGSACHVRHPVPSASAWIWPRPSCLSWGR